MSTSMGKVWQVISRPSWVPRQESRVTRGRFRPIESDLAQLNKSEKKKVNILNSECCRWNKAFPDFSQMEDVILEPPTF